MSDLSPLVLIQLTPPGRGAVTSLRVEGPGAYNLVERHFVVRNGRPLSDFPPGRIVFGRFGSHREEIVLCQPSETAIDIHCHGGLAAVARIEETLLNSSCRRISWQEWITRNEADPIAAAARLALAEARTARTAAILLDQYQGALRRTVEQIESALADGSKDAARRYTQTVLAHAATGLHLIQPWQVVVAGQPNVGKSSFVNAIAGYQRAIVHSLPGTTRDVVSVQTAMDGWPVEISDTAGLRETNAVIERAGIHLAREKIAKADLVVLVFDWSVPWSAADQALADAHPTALLVHNKTDLPKALGSRPPGLYVSARVGEGIDAVCHEIGTRLVPKPPPPGSAVPFTAQQIEQLRMYL